MLNSLIEWWRIGWKKDKKDIFFFEWVKIILVAFVDVCEA
jgi:hypothetical protein